MARVKRQSVQANNAVEKPAATKPRGGNKAEAAYDIIAMAASAGGLSALSAVLGKIPEQFPTRIVVVQK